MEEKIRDFIKQELWELVDAVVNYKYYGGKKIDLEIIEEKAKKLDALVGDYSDEGYLNQAKFIIENAKRG